MTNQEFHEAIAHQTRVLDQIQKLLRDNAMSLSTDENSKIWLCDDGREIGYTGYHVQGAIEKTC